MEGPMYNPSLPPYITDSTMSGNRKHVGWHYHLSRTHEWTPSAGTSLPGDPASLASGSHSTTTPHSPSQPALGHPRHCLYPRDMNMRRKGRLEDGGKMFVSISLSELHGSSWLEGVSVGFSSHSVVQTGQKDKVPDLSRTSSVRIYLSAQESLSKHSPT